MVSVADRLYTAGQVRRLDACAIEERGIPGYTLMSRAGVALFEAARQRFTSANQWLVICGAGNNAGDGFVAARLAREAGLDVDVCALKPLDQLSGDAATAAADWLAAGGSVRTWPLKGGLPPSLIVDALLGTGLDREVGGQYREAVEFINQASCPVVAVDIPSGLQADTGCVMGCAVKADMTVSFIGQKRGLFTADGPDHCGDLRFDELGTPADIHDAIGNSGTRIRESYLYEVLVPRAKNSHKGHFGHVMVVGGAPGMSGAARLAGEAALRSGAGLVTVATHPTHADTLNLSRPELMVEAVAGQADLVDVAERATVLAVGPGLGQASWSKELLAAALGCGIPAVVDADALNLLARNPLRRDDWVLTPHPAEAARLLETDTVRIQSDRVGSALQLAGKYGGAVVLKGCGSVVADAHGDYAICPLGNPGMATAGMGDVLTGVIASLVGQGLSCFEAACAGVVAHAAAGDRVASEWAPRGMLAGDVCGTLPRVLRR